jgi:hypothetical protein
MNRAEANDSTASLRRYQKVNCSPRKTLGFLKNSKASVIL